MTLQHHVVQFYEDDEFLTESVLSFVRTGLQVNETVIIIATASHRKTLCSLLNPDELRHEHLRFFDAATLLSELMVDDWPNPSIFMQVLGSQIQEAGQKGRVRVYGEMVAVLWRDGQYQAALCLEGLWNTLQTTQSFALLHAYPHLSDTFTSLADPVALLAVYHAHSHVYHQNSGTSPASETISS